MMEPAARAAPGPGPSTAAATTKPRKLPETLIIGPVSTAVTSATIVKIAITANSGHDQRLTQEVAPAVSARRAVNVI